MRIGNKTGTDEEKHAQKDGVKRHVRADARSSPVRAFHVIAIYARQIEDSRWTIDNDALTTGARVSKLIYDHLGQAVNRDRAISGQKTTDSRFTA